MSNIYEDTNTDFKEFVASKEQNKMTAKDIVELMNKNNITLHEVGKAMDCELWIWCLDDFVSDLKYRNESFGQKMSEDDEMLVAKRAFEKFEINECGGDYMYEIVHNAINELLEQEMEEFENEKEGE